MKPKNQHSRLTHTVIALAITLLSFKASYAQQDNPFCRMYHDSIPAAFKLNVNDLRDKIYSKISDSLRTVAFPRECYYFADQNACSIAELISGGTIYNDWPRLQDYLNRILKKVMPPELQDDTTIKVYIVQDGNYNAYMTASGHMFMNIGIFAHVMDEATLAGIFAHELAHHYCQHSLKTYLESVRGAFDPSTFYREKKYYRYSVKNELQSDSLAAEWLYRSGYTIDGLVAAFDIMKRNEQNQVRKLADEWELKKTTHPSSGWRYNRMISFKGSHADNNGKRFVVNQIAFTNFKKQAWLETLSALMRNNEYSACMETAFKFHLSDPDNIDYIYYMLESIRRMCYLNSTLWKKPFFTHLYFQDVPKDRRKKPEMTDHLFVKFDQDMLQLSEEEKSNLKANFYWQGNPKFTTYEEAFNFYYLVSQKIGCTECILSNALSFANQPDMRNEALQEYLTRPNLRRRQFAKALLDGTIYNGLSDNKLVAFDNLDITIRQGEDDIRIYNKTPEKITAVNSIIDRVMQKQKGKQAIFMDAYKYTNLRDYKVLMEMESFSMIYTVGVGEKTELHILNPDFWEFYREHKVNEIEFVNARYYEFYSSEKSLDAYKKVVEQDFDSIFADKKCTRYLYSYITSLREIPKGVMKVRRSKENQLEFKSSALKEISNTLAFELRNKEALAQDLDNGYVRNYYILNK